MKKRDVERGVAQRVPLADSYPHPLISCLMPGIAVLTIVAAMLLAFHLWQNTLPGDAVVPMVEGLKADEAVTELARANLNAEVLKQQHPSENVPAGAVISADPAGGRHVKTGRIIRLVISSGSAYTTVPDVRELLQAIALDRLKAANLVIAAEDYAFHPTIPFDRVVSITPKQGTRVEKFSSVALLLSKGPEERTRYPDDVNNVKSSMLSIDLPTSDEPRAMVRIDVSDDEGNRTVYEREHNAGETIMQAVKGSGDVTVKVYYGNRLILTRTF